MRGTHFETDEVPFATASSAGTEFAVAHTLMHGGVGVIPKGWLITKQSGAGSLYRGSTTWTTSAIYLKSDAASISGTMLVF